MRVFKHIVDIQLTLDKQIFQTTLVRNGYWDIIISKKVSPMIFKKVHGDLLYWITQVDI